MVQGRGSDGPAVVLGAPLFNGERHVAEALESLLQQTYRDFVLLLCDDGSQDHTTEIAGRYGAHDARIEWAPSPRRLGLARSWQRCLDEAVRRHPGHAYFAWVSDHDVWHPRWLEALLAALEADPEAVSAFPRVQYVADDGAVLKTPPPRGGATSTSAADRVAYLAREGGSGNWIYGLHRTGALQRTGGFRRVVAPDALMMAELAALGPLRQVPEVLWHRRVTSRTTWERQRAAFFPDGRATRDLPAYTAMYLPPAAVHATLLAVRSRRVAQAYVRGRRDVHVRRVAKRARRLGKVVRRQLRLRR